MQCADRYTIDTIGIPSLVLMERAALEAVRLMEEEGTDLSRVLVVCGSGNNGGDGYAIARLLHLKHYNVNIYFVGKEESRSEENRKQKEICEFYQIPIIEEINDDYSAVIDCIFGTGLKRNIEGNYYEVIDKLNQLQAYKIAIDIPSGVQDNAGTIMGIAFEADLTVAIAFEKRGCKLFPGAEYAGKIVVGDIGITEQALAKDDLFTIGYSYEDFKELYPKRKANSHKGSYGKVLLIVGSKGMSGAAYLCAKAAYAVGAGLVQIYTHEDNRVILQQLLPEAIVSTYTEYDGKQLQNLLDWADVIGIGSGLGLSVTSEKMVDYVLHNTEKLCVVDADALNLIGKYPHMIRNKKAECIFTPHMKEMSRITGCTVEDIIDNRIHILKTYVDKEKVTCVLKDARTLVADEGNEIYLNVTGNASMAKAGSGDVLAGIITGIAAQKAKAFAAASLGVYLHGMAGDAARADKGSYSVMASDLIEKIGAILK